jgi:predicted Zn-dependent peptidase
LEPGKRLSLSQELGRDLTRPVVTSRDIKQLYYRYELFCGELTQPERHAMTLMRLVLLGGMASRIYGEARRRGLAYHVGGGGQAGKGHSSFGFAGYVTPVNATALFELITREMQATLEGRLTPGELEAARSLGIGSTKRSYQTAGDMLGWYLGPYFHEDRILRFDDYLDELLQVKTADLAAVAHKIIQPRRRGISLLGDLDDAQAMSYQELLDPILT